MPWKTLCGFPPTSDTVTLRIPNGAWRPDTVITDYEGTEMFVLLDQTQEMRSYEAVFGDLEGRRLVCIKRHVQRAFWKDGYYLCTYKANYQGQKPLAERDVDNKKVYPFSYLQVNPLKGRFFYRMFDNQEGLGPPRMRAENPWLGFMVVCCTPMVRCGKWTASYKRRTNASPTIHVDQWRNCVDVGPGNDLLAALCMAYIFDRYQCQPLVTVFGEDAEEFESDDKSIASDDQEHMNYRGTAGDAGGGGYRDDPLAGIGDYGDGAAGVTESDGAAYPDAQVDEYGNPITADNAGDAPQYDEFGNPIMQQQPQPQAMLDEYGNPVVDEYGNPVFQEEPVMQQEQQFDEFGNPVNAFDPNNQGVYNEDNAMEQQQQQQPDLLDDQAQYYDDQQQQPPDLMDGDAAQYDDHQPSPQVDEFGNPIQPHQVDEFGNPIQYQDDNTEPRIV